MRPRLLAVLIGFAVLCAWGAAATRAIEPGAGAQDRPPADVQRGGQPAAEQASGWYTAAQAKRGEAEYGERCASCHGREFVPDDFATGLKGPAFEWRWKGRTAYDLFEVIRTTMPPGEGATLSPGTTSDIVAYLLQVNGYPAGRRELPTEGDALRRLRLTDSTRR